MRTPAFIRPQPRLWPVLALLAALFLGAVLPLPAQSDAALEFKVKAAYLYRFACDISWPSSILAAPPAPLVIGWMGEDALEKAFREVLSDKTAAGHPVRLRRLRLTDDPRSCHILFIGAAELAGAFPLINRLSRSPVLTVGDFDGFAPAGGMIQLTLAGDFIRYELNPPALEHAGLAAGPDLRANGRILAEADTDRAMLYGRKAEFLLSLPSHVEWPERAFASDAAPFVIGVMGDNPFGAALSNAAAGRAFLGRPVELRELANPTQAAGCHLVFWSRNASSSLAQTLPTLDGLPVLTVSEIPGFPERGGMINLAALEGRVRLEINRQAAERAGLKIRANLLRLKLARLAENAPGEGPP